jgi:hypothetical protein
MRTPASISSTSHGFDSERAYMAQMGATPRFDREHETERARAVVGARRAYWTILLSRGRLAAVLDAIATWAKDRAIAELSAELRAEVERGAGAETIDHDLAGLAAALDRTGDEHAAAAPHSSGRATASWPPTSGS